MPTFGFGKALARLRKLSEGNKSNTQIGRELVDRDGKLGQLFLGMLIIIIFALSALAIVVLVLAVARVRRPRTRIALLSAVVVALAVVIALTWYIRTNLIEQANDVFSILARYVEVVRAYLRPKGSVAR